MKIELEEPFKSKWRYGYFVTNSENRRNVVLYNSAGDRTTVSYARYLYGVHLGYEVPDHLEVDHKNNDKTDDRLDNYQLLTAEQNRLKQEYKYMTFEQVVYGVYCAYCQSPFLMTDRVRKMRMAQSVEYPFCTKSCSTNYQLYVSGELKIPTDVLTPNDKDKIKQLRQQGMSSYSISAETGFARNTVMKYW